MLNAAELFFQEVLFDGEPGFDGQPDIVRLRAEAEGPGLGEIGDGERLTARVLERRAVRSVAVALFVARVPEPQRGPTLPVARALARVLTDRWSLLLYGLVFVEAGILLGGFAMIPASIELAGGTPAIAGLLTAGYGISVLVMSTKLAAAVLLVIGGSGAIIGFGLLALSISPILVVVSVTLLGVAWVFMHSTLQTWATSLSSEARATAVSLFAGFMFLGNGVGTLLAGWGLENAGARSLFLTVTCIALLLTVIAAISRRRFESRIV